MIRSGGFALVLVLWVLSLLTIMAGSFALSMRREAAIAAGSSNNAQVMAVAESGLAIAELMLMNPDQLRRWRTDGSIYQIDYADSRLRIQLLAETGKIDLNSADQALLQGLIAYASEEAELQTKLVNAILDWRDADDLVRLEGAEKTEYKKAGLSYRPSNKPFQSIEELQLVLGMNEQIFKRLENLVTVYSGQPKVDVAQASKEVLQVLPGMEAGSIEQFIAARRESAINDRPAPTFIARDGVYDGRGEPSAAPTNAAIATAGMNGVNRQRTGAAIENGSETAVNNGTEQQGAITLVSEALLDDGTSAIINALIKKTDNTGSSPFHVLKWQRNAVGDESLFTDEKDALLVRRYAEPEFNN